jgi:hypothetical protein
MKIISWASVVCLAGALFFWPQVGKYVNATANANQLPQLSVTASNIVELHTRWEKGAFDFEKACRDYRLDAKTASMHDAKCRFLGLDPKKTRVFEVMCVEAGVDPAKTTPFKVQCMLLGLDPEKAKVDDLKKFGYKP